MTISYIINTYTISKTYIISCRPASTLEKSDSNPEKYLDTTHGTQHIRLPPVPKSLNCPMTPIKALILHGSRKLNRL